MFYMSKFCLLCLKVDDGHLEYVEQKDLNDVTIQEKLDYCIFELISSGMELPGYVCRQCLEITEKFYKFKQCCFKNNVKVRNLMDSVKQMKFPTVSYRELSVSLEDISKKNVIYSLNNKNKLNILKKEDTPKKYVNNEDKKELVIKEVVKKETDKNKKSKNQYTPAKFTNKLLQCDICNKTYSSVSHLNRHLKLHKTYDCTICLKKFAREDNLLTHKKSHDEITSTPKEKNKRNKLKVLTESYYQCNICKTKIMYQTNLKRHLKKVHRKGAIHITSFFTFVTPADKSHIIDLTNIDDDDEDINVSNMSELQNNITKSKVEIQEQETEKDTYNEDLQTSKENLSIELHNLNTTKEMNDESRNKNKVNLTCFICDKIFTRNCTLNAHITNHFKDTSNNKQLKL